MITRLALIAALLLSIPAAAVADSASSSSGSLDSNGCRTPTTTRHTVTYSSGRTVTTVRTTVYPCAYKGPRR